MKKITLLALSTVLSLSASLSANASEHHSGHGGGPRGSSSGTGVCKPQLSKFLPAHLTTVIPGAEFSFIAFNLQKADQIYITVKNIPVEFEAEFKDPYFLIKSKLPSSLHDTYARINIKVKAKSSECEIESGWLLNIVDR
jgi:hypothetical protein